jgi:hypothetical protein
LGQPQGQEHLEIWHGQRPLLPGKSPMAAIPLAWLTARLPITTHFTVLPPEPFSKTQNWPV